MAVVSSDPPRFSLVDAGASGADFAADVRAGLTAAPRSLPPRWFYDDVGSSLFDTICFLPEYYVLRAESEILSGSRTEIAQAFGPRIRLVELGSGLARKTRILLDAVTARQPQLDYLPVDIDAAVLERSGRQLIAEYPGLRVTALRADLTRPSAAILAAPAPRGIRTVVLFLGSTIGNFDPPDAIAMLADLRSALAPGDALLLGADLKKSKAFLEPAYDDALGVTAAFNRNLLARINRELGGRFDLGSFDHRAFYDEERGRIEMHLVSREPQSVRIEALGLEIHFAAGETIHTESSWKYDSAGLAALAAASGFRIERSWNDARAWFADVLMVAV
jgi:L-histidine N-alpha-methyltransferase